jgi:hypothetical protein
MVRSYNTARTSQTPIRGPTAPPSSISTAQSVVSSKIRRVPAPPMPLSPPGPSSGSGTGNTSSSSSSYTVRPDLGHDMNRMLVSNPIWHEFVLITRTTCKVKEKSAMEKERESQLSSIVLKEKSTDLFWTGLRLYLQKVKVHLDHLDRFRRPRLLVQSRLS